MDCKSFSSVEDYVSNTPKQSRSNLSFMYTNARSLRNKFSEFKMLIDSLNCPDVIIISETWIRPGEEKYFSLCKYNMIHTIRGEMRGGGVAVYAKETMELNVVEQITGEHCIQVSELAVNNNRFHVIAVYNNNIHNADLFLNDLENLIDKYISKNLLIVGDCNIDVLKDNEVTRRYYDIIHTAGLEMKITLPTRTQGNASTLIDHVVMRMGLKCEASVIVSDFSDHNIVMFNTGNFNKPNHKKISRLKINFRKANDYFTSNPFNVQTEDVNAETVKFIEYVKVGIDKASTIVELPNKNSHHG